MYSITWLVAIRIEWPKLICFYSRHMQKQECSFVNESELKLILWLQGMLWLLLNSHSALVVSSMSK